MLGTNENGGIKAKNEFIHTTNWDLVIFDEYHFGAWRENAKKLFEAEDEETEFDAEWSQRERDSSGREANPKDLAADSPTAKPARPNPYASLPKMVMMTYKVPESINQGTGIDMHEGENVGGWDTVIRREEYEKLFHGQQLSIKSS